VVGLAIRDGQTLGSPGAFVFALVEGLRAAIEPVLDEVEERVSSMERLLAKFGRRSGRAERGALLGTVGLLSLWLAIRLLR
jgi:hypothetical protein